MSMGIIVFAHGSRVEPANEAVRSVAAQFACAGGYENVTAAFLELGTPSLEEAAAQMAARGLCHIIVIPYFLTLGLHLERDLPRLIADISNKYNGIQITVTPPLDGHPALIEILKARAADAVS